MDFMAVKSPVIFAQYRDNSFFYGGLYLGNGTVFGYFQPRFAISGSFSLDGNELDATGTAALIHYWGGSSVEIFEFIYAQYKDMDILSLTYYSTGGENIVLEELYVIYSGSYSFYSTSEESSIGAYIENETYRSLAGQNYCLYPTSYLLDPTDPYNHRAYGCNWTISSTYDDFDIEIHPVVKQQFPSGVLWAGATSVKENGITKGWGFSVMNKRYNSDPYISQIYNDTYRINGKWYMSVTAIVDDTIPLEKVVLYYNTTDGSFFANMRLDEKTGIWKTEIGAFEEGNMTYYVVAIDTAGNRDSSELFSENFP